jgi:hypothetical protein
MHSPAEVFKIKQDMLIKKLAYLRAERELTEMSIYDIKIRHTIMADLDFSIQLAAKEMADMFNHVRLGPRHTQDARGLPLSDRDRACGSVSGEASAVNTGNEGGC